MHHIDFTAAWIAVVVFTFFLSFIAMTAIGKARAPLRRLCSLHLLFAGIYLVTTLFFSRVSWDDRFVGLSIFMLLQYPFLFILVGQISRGFSLNLCVSAIKHGGHVTENEILENYSGGRGITHVRIDRLRTMLEFKVATNSNDIWRLTRVGAILVRINRLVLQVFALDYLAKPISG